MKEYVYKTGGRKIYNEDIENLQELALSCTELLKDCGINFVLSGCKIAIRENGNNTNTMAVSVGYVFADGKIRPCSSKIKTYNSNATVYPVITFGQRNGQAINYADGTSKEQYSEYYATANILTEDEYETAVSDGEIMIVATNNYFPDLRTAWFEHYAILKNPVNKQTLNGDLEINGSVDTDEVSVNTLNIQADNTKAYLNNGNGMNWILSDNNMLNSSKNGYLGTFSGFLNKMFDNPVPIMVENNSNATLKIYGGLLKSSIAYSEDSSGNGRWWPCIGTISESIFKCSAHTPILLPPTIIDLDDSYNLFDSEAIEAHGVDLSKIIAYSLTVAYSDNEYWGTLLIGITNDSSDNVYILNGIMSYSKWSGSTSDYKGTFLNGGAKHIPDGGIDFTAIFTI